MFYQIPVWVAISFVLLIIGLSVYGYFRIKSIHKKESERRQLNKEINQIGKK